MGEKSDASKNEMKGLAWSMSFSILVVVGWLVFLVLWLFFYAKNYAWERNIAVFLLSVLLLAAALGIPWTYWAFKKQNTAEKEMWKLRGFRWRVWVSIIVIVSVIIFLIYWFWMIAEPYSIYQNLAIFIVAFFIVGGLLTAMWLPWGMMHNPKPHCDEQLKSK
ncbi:hypothetical protein AYK25_03175 [Thermoplasmatales archaeon SM1-50]|nr:MAG: hypothetical protein AYK25_03175 [Thermoplasmatales archaeon SM1-50]